jgi:hypothetical protein
MRLKNGPERPIGQAVQRILQRVVQFRSAEDPAVPPDAAFCDGAPLQPKVRLGASLYSHEVDRSGEVKQGEGCKIGTATACARLTDPKLPAGTQLPFVLKFDLPEGSFTAAGTCSVASNDVPERGLVLAGCALRLTAFPKGVLGGVVTSLSTFNPSGLPGFATGSWWTLQYYYGSASADSQEEIR